MADNISLILKTILSSDKSDIEEQIRKLSGQIKERLELKLKINAEDLQVLTKQVDEVHKKIKTKTVTNDSLFINNKVEQQAFNEITSRLKEVKKNVDELAKVRTQYSVDEKGRNKLETATLSYYNKELGQTVTETMRWVESEKMVNGELEKTRTFRSIGLDISDDMAKANAESEKLAQSLTNLNLFKQKMLGGNGFTGELDIFASKQKGKYDVSALSKIKTDIQGLSKDTPDLQNKIKQLGIEFSSLKQQASDSGNVMSRALENVGKFLRFYLVGGLIVGFVNSLKDSISVVRDLDTSITDLKKVSDEIGKTVGVKTFLNDINKLAIEVGHSTKAAIDSITDFKRLGYTLEQSTALAKQALIYSNISDQDIESATQSLISTLKGYQLGVQDVNKVMDAYNEVGNNFQITSAGIGSALQRSSATLYEAGNTLEQSIGLITAANSSIQNPEKVGNGLKTVAMRIRGIADESGEAVPQLDKLIKSITGVEIMKDANTFKSTYDIMVEISKVWRSLTDTNRATLLEQMFGKHQGAVGASLLNNMTDGIKATETAINSAGSSAREQARYMESINAKINTFSETVAKLWVNTISSETVKRVVDFGTAIITLVDKFGLINTAIISATLALTIFNKTFAVGFVQNVAVGASGLLTTLAMKLGILTTVSTTATSAIATLSTVIGMVAPVAIVGGILGLVKVIDTLTLSTKEASEAIGNSYSETEQNINSLRDITKEYDALSKKEQKNSEDKNRLLEIQSIINTKYLDGKKNLSLYTDSINNNSEAVSKNIEKLKELEKNEAERFLRLNKSNYNISKNFLKDDYYFNQLDLNKSFKNPYQALDYFGKLAEGGSKYAYDVYKKLSKEINNAEDAVVKYDNAQRTLSATLDNSNKIIDDNADSIEKRNKALAEANKALEEANKAIDGYQSSLDELSDSYNKLQDGQTLSITQIIDLIQKYPELASAIKKTKDGYIIEASAIKTLAETKFNELKLHIQTNKDKTTSTIRETKTRISAMESEIKVLDILMQKNIDVLSTSSNERDQAIAEKLYSKNKQKYDSYTKAIQEEKKSLTSLENTLKGYDTILNSGAGDWFTSNDSSNKNQKNKFTQDYLTGVQKIDNELSLLNSQYQDLAESSSNFAKQEMLLNEIIDKQIEKQTELHSSAEQMRKDRDALAKTMLINPNLSQTEINARFNKLTPAQQQLWSDQYSQWQSLDRGANQASQEWWNAENAKKQAQKNLTNIPLAKLDNLFKESDKTLQVFEQHLSDLDYQFKMLDDDDTAGKMDLLNKKIEAGTEYTQALEKEISNLTSITPATAEEAEKLKDKIADFTKQLMDGKLSVKEYSDSLVNLQKKESETQFNKIKEVEEKIVQIIKKRYEQEMKAEDKRHQKRMDDLDDELKKFNDVINEQMEKLDEQFEQDNYQKALKEENEKLAQIQSDINKYDLADDIESRNKVIDLTKEKAEQEKRIEELKNKHNYDEQKKNLNKMSDNYEKYIATQKKEEDTAYKNFKTDWEKRSADTEVYLEAQGALMSGTIKNIEGNFISLQTIYKEFENEFGEGMGILGNKIKTDFIAKINEAIQAVKNLNTASSFSPSISTPSTSPTQSGNAALAYGDAKHQYVWMNSTKNPYYVRLFKLDDVAKAMKDEEGWKYATPEKVTGLGFKVFDSGGYTGNSRGLAWLDEQEIVLNKPDTSNLLKAVDITRSMFSNLSSMIKVPQISNNKNANVHFDSMLTVNGNITPEAMPMINKKLDSVVNKLKRGGLKPQYG